MWGHFHQHCSMFLWRSGESWKVLVSLAPRKAFFTAKKKKKKKVMDNKINALKHFLKMLKYFHQLKDMHSKVRIFIWQLTSREEPNGQINDKDHSRAQLLGQACRGITQVTVCSLKSWSLQRKGSGKACQEERKIKNVPQRCVKAVRWRTSEMWHKVTPSGWCWEPKMQCHSEKLPHLEEF